MVRRRAQYDWLKEGAGKEHVVTANDMFGNTIESRKIPVQSDLRRTLVEVLAQWSADGWTIEDFSSARPNFFCTKGAKRLHVSIAPIRPDAVAAKAGDDR